MRPTNLGLIGLTLTVALTTAACGTRDQGDSSVAVGTVFDATTPAVGTPHRTAPPTTTQPTPTTAAPDITEPATTEAGPATPAPGPTVEPPQALRDYAEQLAAHHPLLVDCITNHLLTAYPDPWALGFLDASQSRANRRIALACALPDLGETADPLIDHLEQFRDAFQAGNATIPPLSDDYTDCFVIELVTNHTLALARIVVTGTVSTDDYTHITDAVAACQVAAR